ncbi:MAG: DUF1015 domain-containing protein [Candidatus Zixiibacteriota bacterium]
MAKVKPFKSLRPRPEIAEKVASPPYDVLSSKEARELVKDNPESFLHVVKPEIDLPEGTDLYSEEVYQKGAENLKRLEGAGYLIRDEKPCFYLYRQIMGDHSQVGFVAGASVDEYDEGLIKKHEHTRQKKEDDRTKHVDTLNANTGPVFLTYRNTVKLDEIANKVTAQEPDVDFTSPDDVQHTLWVVDDEEMIKEIQNAFEEIPALYVADGHHRSASASRVQKLRKEKNPNHTGDEEYNYFLTVIFPDNQMKILDYNRVIKDLNGLSEDEFIAKIKEKFEIEEIGKEQYKPQNLHEFGMYLDGKWYKLIAKEGTFDPNNPVEQLDVAILQENLLAPVLGIGDPRKDERIDFVGGIRGLGELEKRCEEGWKVAFSLYPTSIEQLMNIADADLIMPPKSTWFEPKLRSGMIIHTLD